MKHLLLLRHAKSVWEDASLPDIERPLSPRGLRDAPRIGRALRQRQPSPEIVLCSTAIRARETALAVLKAAHIEIEPQFTPALYAASSEEILEVVTSLPEEVACAMLVGHNPGFEVTAGRLTGKSREMPTGTVACLALDVEEWKDVVDKTGRLEWLLTPKDADRNGR